MAAFKEAFNPAMIERMCDALTQAVDSFDAATFRDHAALSTLETLELKARARLISDALHIAVPGSFPEKIASLLPLLGPPTPLDDKGELATLTEDQLAQRAAAGWTGFTLWPLSMLVAQHGLEHFDTSINALAEITQRFTAEFAIRPFLIRHPKRTLRILQDWTAHESAHLRRLVSEGSRSRLPWGMRLQHFATNPAPLIPLLDALRHDPSAYVRRSVANNLNDITKDNPKVALKLLKRWLHEPSEHTPQLARHALRTLIKQGDPKALALLGYRRGCDVRIEGLVCTSALELGEVLELSFEIVSHEDHSQPLVVDFALWLVRANDKRTRKVFKMRTLTLKGRERVTLTKRHLIREVTTRRYYSGHHKVDILLNGRVLASTGFELTT